jgi:hypothetical protein
VGSTQILEILAKNPGAYILDDMSGDIVLKNADGSDMIIHDDDGRWIIPRFPYPLIEGLIQQSYIEQEKNTGRIYRISHDGLKATQS